MPEFSVDELTDRERARLVKSAVTPRPIAWVSTVGEDGVDNLAPFSSYTYVGSSEPILQFNASRASDGGPKDTVRNALDTEEFAVNVVTEPLIEAMDHTSKSVPPDESEFDLAGVQRAACRTIDPPRVADAVVTMECGLFETFDVRDRTMVLGDVQHVHVDESILTDGEVDTQKIPTVGRLGGPYYTVSEPVDFERQF